ncbi:MAG: PH domain-containing protein [Thermoleophilia bacterium]
MELSGDEKVLWQGRPSWRAHLSFFIVWIPLALAPFIIAAILSANDQETGLPVWQWFLISLALIVGVLVFDYVQRYATHYAVTTQRLRVRRGILSRKEQTARFERVQNVNISQSFMDRMVKVGSVEFDTAGSDAADSDFRYSGIADPQRLVAIVHEYTHGHPEAMTGGL